MYSAREAAAVRRVNEHARLLVRAGFAARADITADVTSVAVDEGLPEPAATAVAAVRQAYRALGAEQTGWPSITDVDRLHDVFALLRADGVVVLEGVPDHWSAARELERLDELGAVPAGIAWFTAPDVWHAIDHGMLEINLWHGDSANAAPGDVLLRDVLARFDQAGLSAVFDEGRIEIRARWHRRTAGMNVDGGVPAEHLP